MMQTVCPPKTSYKPKRIKARHRLSTLGRRARSRKTHRCSPALSWKFIHLILVCGVECKVTKLKFSSGLIQRWKGSLDSSSSSVCAVRSSGFSAFRFAACLPTLSPTGTLAWVPPLAVPRPRHVAGQEREFRHIVAAAGPRALPREFPHYRHSEWQGRIAHLRLSQTRGCQWYDLKAVCARHANCGRSRSCRTNRPLGELWAWLDQMHMDTCVSKAQHCAYVPSFETRCAARAAFKALPDTGQFLAAEAVQPGNIDEPL